MAGNDGDLRWMVVQAQVDMPMCQGKWAEGEKKFMEAAGVLPDNELNALLSRVLSRAKAANVANVQPEMTDRLCEYVLSHHRDKHNTVRSAAFRWLDPRQTGKDVAVVPKRIAWLLDKRVDSDLVYNIYSRRFYDVVGSDNRVSILAMMEVGEKILLSEVEPESRGQIQTMLADGAFVMEDYAKAIKIIEEGVQGRDVAWHEMSLLKTKAHLALKEGRNRDAVEHLRKFMDCVARWKQPEQDPVTGVFYSKEMCLGRNGRRIGDILKTAGDNQAAEQAYAGARKNLGAALSEVKADSPEAEVIRAELSKLPPATDKK
jgi:hypothetical protein